MPVEAPYPGQGPDDQGKKNNEGQDPGILFPPAGPGISNEALRNVFRSDQDQSWIERRNTFIANLDTLEVRVDSDLRFYGLTDDKVKK